MSVADVSPEPAPVAEGDAVSNIRTVRLPDRRANGITLKISHLAVHALETHGRETAVHEKAQFSQRRGLIVIGRCDPFHLRRIASARLKREMIIRHAFLPEDHGVGVGVFGVSRTLK